MSSQRAWTSEPVHFRMGRSRGTGRDMEILFSSKDQGPQGGTLRGVTLHKLRLQRDVRMRLEMTSGPLAADATPPPADESEPPIEITCTGPFEFDMQAYAASFEENVDVFRLNPVGKSDQLNCALLTVYFTRSGESSPEAAAQPAGAPPSSAASRMR